jgi:beta-glucosidase
MMERSPKNSREEQSLTHEEQAAFTFPEHFKFGTATSATQVEGHCEETDWAAFARQPGRIRNGDTPALACDHWERWKGDIAIQHELRLNAHRLSIEWARIEPRPGEFDTRAIERYRAMLGALTDSGITPLVTLHHFSLPQWLSDGGGLLCRDLPDRLTRYTTKVVQALGDLCRWWITINEPSIVVTQGYVVGTWPPGKRSLLAAWRANGNLLASHTRMYRAIHSLQPEGAVGVAHHFRIMDAARSDRLGDRAGAALIRWASDAFARAVCEGSELGTSAGLPGAGRRFRVAEARGTQDFFGLNYYTRSLVRFSPRHPRDFFLPLEVAPGAEVNDLGWQVYPEGLGRLLTDWSERSGRPIVVAENGIADAADAQRSSFLVRHLAEVARAISRGVDVQGYFHWSLLDNFEWAEGYEPRFGIVEVDYASQERRVRGSAYLYSRIAASRTIDAETWKLHGAAPLDARLAPVGLGAARAL